MQPYRNIQQEKGLFTFYREQAEIQQNFSYRGKNKKIKVLNQNQQHCQQNQRFTNINTEDNLNLGKLKHEILNKKYKQFKNSKNMFDPLGQIQQEHQQNNLDLKIKKSEINPFQRQNLQKKQHIHQNGSQYEKVHHVFKKYNSQVNQLKYKKTRKINVHDIEHKKKQKPKFSQQAKKSYIQKLKVMQKGEQHQPTKIQYKQLFKKLAIQPKQFQTQAIQQSLSSFNSPHYKKQKTGLKSYKKQKLNYIQENKSKLKINLAKENSTQPLQNFQFKDALEELRHIKTQKNSIKYNPQDHQKLINTKQHQLPVILKRKNPQTDRGYSMEFQLQRSSQLKNKYSIKKMQQEEHNLRQIRMHLKKGSLDESQIKSHLRDDKIDESNDLDLFPHKKEYQDKIFVNRKNQRNFLKNIRMPIFQQNESRQSKVQKQFLLKKKQLLHNLLQNFNFL